MSPNAPSSGHVCGLQISGGGVPKLAVDEIDVGVEGIAGDVQRDLRYHGGPMRAVCLLAGEVIDELRAAGHPITPGSTGENLTVRGVGTTFAEGTRLTFDGGVVLEVTQPAAPCKNISDSFHDANPEHLSAKRAPHYARYYARVVTPGRIARDASVSRLP